jgi:hypothetical protein
MKDKASWPGTIIDNLVDERGWEVVFGTSMIEIMKVGADANSALFLLTGMGLETHEVYAMGYMNPDNA